MRLIDADALKMKAERFGSNMTELLSFEFVTVEDIDEMPTVCDIEQSAILMRKLYEEYEHTLEQIRTEIENIKDFEVVNGGLYVRQYDVVQIIDKYTKWENKL